MSLMLNFISEEIKAPLFSITLYKAHGPVWVGLPLFFQVTWSIDDKCSSILLCIRKAPMVYQL